MSGLSAGASAYMPSWMKASAKPYVPSAAVTAPQGSPPPPHPAAAPTASRMTVTRTTTNATSAMAPPPPPTATPYNPPPALPTAVPRPYSNGGRPSSTSLQPVQSPSLTPGGSSPSLSKRLPTRTRMSPAITPSSRTHMNPYANEFVPGRSAMVAGGGAGAGELDILPASTADVDAQQHGTPSRQPMRSPAWQPSYKRASRGSTPVMAPLRLDGKTEHEIAEIGRRSALKADAQAYNPSALAKGRTLNRVMVSRTPLTLAQKDPNKAGMEMMLDDLWSLFYMPANFGESIKEETYNPTLVFRIESIPTFWKVVNNVPKPSAMQLSTLYLFKDGIDPKWEDAANRNGGMIKVKVGADQIDEAWELLLCKTIGDSWTPVVRDTVNGVALKVRDRGYLLEVWVTKQTPELMRDLGDLWRQTLGAAFAAGYYSHEAMQSKAAAVAAATAEKQKKQHAQRKRW